MRSSFSQWKLILTVEAHYHSGSSFSQWKLIMTRTWTQDPPILCQALLPLSFLAIEPSLPLSPPAIEPSLPLSPPCHWTIPAIELASHCSYQIVDIHSGYTPPLDFLKFFAFFLIASVASVVQWLSRPITRRISETQDPDWSSVLPMFLQHFAVSISYLAIQNSRYDVYALYPTFVTTVRYV